MSDEHDEQVEGVTFWFVASSMVGSDLKSRRVQLTLNCHIHDEALWSAVEQKFHEGFRVFTSPDFHVEVADVLRMRIKDLEGQCLFLKRVAEQERDHKERALAELAPFRALSRAFGGGGRVE